MPPDESISQGAQRAEGKHQRRIRDYGSALVETDPPCFGQNLSQPSQHGEFIYFSSHATPSAGCINVFRFANDQLQWWDGFYSLYQTRAELSVTCRIKPNPPCGDFFRRPSVCSHWTHVHDNVQVVAHNRSGVHPTGENVAKLQNAGFNPRLSMLETFAEVFVQAAQPRPANTAIYAVKSPRLSWIYKLAAGLSHGCSLGRCV